MKAFFIWISVLLANLSIIAIAQSNDKTDRIYAGRPADIEEFPYQVAILAKGAFSCGGSIIENQLILTAAHCVDEFKANNIFPREVIVRTGTSRATIGGESHEVVAWKAHEDYRSDDPEDKHDIALMMLKYPMHYSNVQKPIKLAKRPPPANTKGWITGFGKTDQSAGGDFLMAAEVPTVNKQTCKKILGGKGSKVSYDTLCAGGGKNVVVSRDACAGDSGGPYVINRIQVGIVAWGLGCGEVGVPGVYTSVALYRSWIDQTAKILLGVSAQSPQRYFQYYYHYFH